MSANRPARSLGAGEGDSRRPIGYWAAFNNWWRTRLSEDGCRPSQVELLQWFETNGPLCWQPEEMPSLQEVRTHAKCLRSTEQVRNYFRKYRAARKANSASVRASGSDSDSDGGAPSQSVSMSRSMSVALQPSVHTVATGDADAAAGAVAGGGPIPQRSHSTAVTTGADPHSQRPFVFGGGGGGGGGGGARIFQAGAGGALAGFALQAGPAGASSSPRAGYKPNGSLPIPHQQQAEGRCGVMGTSAGGGDLGRLAESMVMAALPPVAAAVSGPVISFSSGGLPQHSTHGPGPTRSIGGGIVVRLPDRAAATTSMQLPPPQQQQQPLLLQRAGSGGSASVRPSGAAPSPTKQKHSSPAPPAPAAKRQATGRPVCSTGQASSVHQGSAARPVPYACVPSVSCASGMEVSRQGPGAASAMAAAAGFPTPAMASGALFHRSRTAATDASTGCPDAAQGYEMEVPTAIAAPSTAPGQVTVPTLLLLLPAATAAAATTAAPGTGCGDGSSVLAPQGLPKVQVAAGVQPGPEDEADAAGALSPTQAFFHAWQQNEVDDLLLDLPGEADGSRGRGGLQGANGSAAVAAAAVAAAAATTTASDKVTSAATAVERGPAQGAEANGTALDVHASPSQVGISVQAEPTGAPSSPPPPLPPSAHPQQQRTQSQQVQQQGKRPSQSSLQRQGSIGGGQASVDAELRWWPDPSGDVGSGLPPIRTSMAPPAGAPSGSHAPSQPAPGRQQQQAMPSNAAAPCTENGSGGDGLPGGAGSATEGAGDEGLSPASAHELFSILELTPLQIPSLVAKQAASRPPPTQQYSLQQQAMTSQAASQARSQLQRDAQGAAVTSEPSCHSEGAVPRGAAPAMAYHALWPAPSPYHPPCAPPLRDSAIPDIAAAAAATASNGMGPPPPSGAMQPPASAGGPYHSAICAQYPYNYPPYGYCPPLPYSLPPHLAYYYHQMAPPPSGNGYEMYGWPPYHLPPQAMPYPGAPYGSEYPGYPVALGPHMLPPPLISDCPTSDFSSHLNPYGGGGRLEGSSVRVRGPGCQGPAAIGAFIPPTGPAAAEPFMPGRYVFQATTGGAIGKLRRAPSVGPSLTEAGECTGDGVGGGGSNITAIAGATDGVSSKYSRARPAVSGRGVQGSYCSTGRPCYSQSIGAVHTQAVTEVTATTMRAGTSMTAAATLDQDECVESVGGSGRSAAPGGSQPATGPPAVPVSQQLMPPPPPRQPRLDKAAAAPAPSKPQASGSSGRSQQLPSGLPLPLLFASAAAAVNVGSGILTQGSPRCAHSSVPPHAADPASTCLPPGPAAAPVSAPQAAPPAPPATLPQLQQQRQQQQQQQTGRGSQPKLQNPTGVVGAAAAIAPQPPAAPPLQETRPAPTAAAGAGGAGSQYAHPKSAGEEVDAGSTDAAAGAGAEEAAAAVYVCDDSDLLDLSSLTAGLFSPPGSEARCGPGRAVGPGSGGAPLRATPTTATAAAAAAATSTFTPISAHTAARSQHAFAAPPRPLAAASTPAGVPTSQHHQQQHNAPTSCRSTDLLRSLVTPRSTGCGSPLDCSLLASWLTSPASIASLDACTRGLGLGLGLLGPLEGDGQEQGCGGHELHGGGGGDSDSRRRHAAQEEELTGIKGQQHLLIKSEPAAAAVVGAEYAHVAAATLAAFDAPHSRVVGEKINETLPRAQYTAADALYTAEPPPLTETGAAVTRAAGAVTVAAPTAPDLTAHIRITYVPARSAAAAAAVNACGVWPTVTTALKEEEAVEGDLFGLGMGIGVSSAAAGKGADLDGISIGDWRQKPATGLTVVGLDEYDTSKCDMGCRNAKKMMKAAAAAGMVEVKEEMPSPLAVGAELALKGHVAI